MSVTATGTDLLILPQSGIEPLARRGDFGPTGPATGFETFFEVVTVVGDVSGGTVTLNCRIPQDDWYYTVTSLHAHAASAAVDENARINLSSNDFEQYEQAGQNRTWTAEAILSSANLSLKPGDWVSQYLGRAVSATADVNLLWATNTDGVPYFMRIAGLRSLQPGVPWYNALQQARAL